MILKILTASLTSAFILFCSFAGHADDYFDMSNMASPLNPLNPASPLNPNNMDAGPTAKEISKASDVLIETYMISDASKITISLIDFQSQLLEKYYINLDFCQLTNQSRCLGLNMISQSFSSDDIGSSILNFEFHRLTDYGWLGLAELATASDLIVLVRVVKKEPWYRRNILVDKKYLLLDRLINQPRNEFILNKALNLKVSVRIGVTNEK